MNPEAENKPAQELFIQINPDQYPKAGKLNTAINPIPVDPDTWFVGQQSDKIHINEHLRDSVVLHLFPPDTVTNPATYTLKLVNQPSQMILHMQFLMQIADKKSGVLFRWPSIPLNPDQSRTMLGKLADVLDSDKYKISAFKIFQTKSPQYLSGLELIDIILLENFTKPPEKLEALYLTDIPVKKSADVHRDDRAWFYRIDAAYRINK
jgi:hypothetical protein